MRHCPVLCAKQGFGRQLQDGKWHQVRRGYGIQESVECGKFGGFPYHAGLHVDGMCNIALCGICEHGAAVHAATG